MTDHGDAVAWGILIAAGVLEVVWAIALKQADGFTRLGPSAVGLVAAVASFLLLAAALKSLPVGTAYAVWVGIGALGVAVAGMLAFGEPATAVRVVYLALIVVGVAGLRFVES